MPRVGSADLVVVGAGAIGGWASYFAKAAGGERVVVLERHLVGEGASGRAAGMVRAQAGTPATVRLGMWSIDFYRRQAAILGTDSGFREMGYLMLAVTERDVREGMERVTMQREAGLNARWVGAQEAVKLNPTLAAGGHRGGSYVETDGFVDPERNIRAYSLAMQQVGVEVRERNPFVGLRTASRRGRLRVTGVRTPGGLIATERVILTGGPMLRQVGELIDVPIWVGAARHTVAVTSPHPAFQVERLPMVFDLGGGLYWRLEEGGLLFGFSDPDDTPGPSREIDWGYLRRMRRRLARFVPVTAGLGLRKVWAATIEYSPDHLPIVGPAITRKGHPIDGVIVASACGHGMMFGPAIARAAVDLALTGRTEVTDVSELGLDRFDEKGRSSAVVDPVAVRFPAEAGGGDEPYWG